MPRDLHDLIQQSLEDSWAALDVIMEAYTEGLTTAQLMKVIRCRELLVELLVEREDT
jgi:hypothetical protein